MRISVRMQEHVTSRCCRTIFPLLRSSKIAAKLCVMYFVELVRMLNSLTDMSRPLLRFGFVTVDSRRFVLTIPLFKPAT